MGRIVCQAKIENATNGHEGFEFSALVDTGTSHLTLPMTWKDRLGELQSMRPVEMETANQSTISGVMGGPVKIQIEGFPAIYSEVLFVDMEPRNDGSYEPLMGYHRAGVLPSRRRYSRPSAGLYKISRFEIMTFRQTAKAQIDEVET